MGLQKNIFEDILKFFLERSLSLRFDICTCDKCKATMMLHLLSRFTPHYVDVSDPRYKEIEQELGKKFYKEIFAAVNEAINRVSAHAPHAQGSDKEKEFEMLLHKIRADRGIDFTQYHTSILKRRLAPRLLAKKVKSYAEYLEVLARDPEEYQKLYDVFTINVSSFFRDSAVWRGIRTVMIKALSKARDKNDSVRIWSAGCAQGQEPYSLAILSREIGDFKVPLIIYATDIDRESLKTARSGTYEAADVKSTMHKLAGGHCVFNLQKYFDFRENKAIVKDEIKQIIEFRTLNLTSQDTIPDADIILCRNVFIYFTKPLQERIVDKFYRSLKNGGYFIIGNTENLVSEAKSVFREIDAMNRIYQKIGENC